MSPPTDRKASIVRLDHLLAKMSRDLNHCALRSWLLVPSSAHAASASLRNPTDNTLEVVPFIRIDDAITKTKLISGDVPRNNSDPLFDRRPSPPATLVVERGFSGSVVTAHRASSRVLAPVFLDTGVVPPVRAWQWAVDMSGQSDISSQLLANNTI